MSRSLSSLTIGRPFLLEERSSAAAREASVSAKRSLGVAVSAFAPLAWPAHPHACQINGWVSLNGSVNDRPQFPSLWRRRNDKRRPQLLCRELPFL